MYAMKRTSVANVCNEEDLNPSFATLHGYSSATSHNHYMFTHLLRNILVFDDSETTTLQCRTFLRALSLKIIEYSNDR